jgi:hypothetical protein
MEGGERLVLAVGLNPNLMLAYRRRREP